MAWKEARASWCGYVRSMLYKYPARAAKADSLDNIDLWEYEAVAQALAESESWPNGDHIRRLVDMVFFKQSHTLVGAAQRIPCSYETAKRWQQKFIRTVATHFKCEGLYIKK